MQINNLNDKKKKINHISEYIADIFGFNLFEINEKTFKTKDSIEDEKKKTLDFYIKKKNNKKNKIPDVFFYKKPVSASKLKKHNSAIGLDIINIENPIAEATIIKTAIAILKEEGYTDIQIRLNAIGTKDSVEKWKKSLISYYRENRTKLKKVEQKNISKNPFAILLSEKEYLKEINFHAPSSLEYLSEKNIKHFQEVIEFLENFKINYTVDEKMIGDRMIFSKTIFKIFAKSPKSDKLEEVAFGGRYDEEAAKIAHKRKFYATGLTLHFLKKDKKKIKLKEKEVVIHLLKIGQTAKLKYLNIIEIFKKLSIPINYDIKEDKISKQIKVAEKNNADFLVIIGESEAKKDKVLIRTTENSSQDEIKISEVETYMKKKLK